MLIVNWLSRFTKDVHGARQLHQKSGSGGRRRFQGDRSGVIANDFIDDGQAQPGSIGFTKANEGVKQGALNGGRHTGAVIDYANFKKIGKGGAP